MTNYVDLDSLSAITLRHLAALREEFDRTRDQARYVDYRAMAEELAMMLYEGRTPTIGWYRRRLRPVEPGVPVELGILVEWGKNGIPETPLPAALGSNRMGSDNRHGRASSNGGQDPLCRRSRLLGIVPIWQVGRATGADQAGTYSKA